MISAWLKVPPPSAAKDVSVEEALDRLGTPEVHEPHTRLAAAVAAIALEDCRNELPNWTAVRVSDGQLLEARPRPPEWRSGRRPEAPASNHLFTINWATSGPGFDWPAMYRATWMPRYNVFVLTTSHDTDEIFGTCDAAIGHIEPGQSEVLRGGHVVRDFWQRLVTQFDSSRFESVLREGQMRAVHVEALANEVWGGQEDEENEA